mgnify:CR=1 FL=1
MISCQRGRSFLATEKISVPGLDAKFRFKRQGGVKMEITDKGKNNKIIGDLKGEGKIRIEGNNNKIVIDGLISNINFKICGNNNIMHIKENVSLFKGLKATITGNESKLEIKKNTTIVKAYILINEDKNKVEIGEDCMFSDNVIILASDSHSIISTDTGKCINAHKNGVTIGNHVWIGMNVLILKDVKIGDNSIVAGGAVVTYKKAEKNIIIAGNPSKKIKKGVTWERKTPTEDEIAQEVQLQGKINKGNIHCFIEERLLNENYLKRLSGWAYLDNLDSAQSEIYIEIKNKKYKKIYKAKMNERPDIANNSNNKKHLNSGFSIIFPGNINKNQIEDINVIIKNTNNIYETKISL